MRLIWRAALLVPSATIFTSRGPRDDFPFYSPSKVLVRWLVGPRGNENDCEVVEDGCTLKFERRISQRRSLFLGWDSGR